jgi:dCMP deaminase
MRRIKQKIDAFVNIVQTIAGLSVSSTLKVGCIAVKHDFSRIASIGYNGSFAGDIAKNGVEEDSMEPGQSGFIHAEVNMITKFRAQDPENYIVLLTHSPCNMCSKILVNAGFTQIYWISEYRDMSHISRIFNNRVQYGNIQMLLMRMCMLHEIQVLHNNKRVMILDTLNDNTAIIILNNVPTVVDICKLSSA